jgi:hypothetical protein
MKTFTENTHIVAVRVSGNVYEAETIERLNAKTKNWRDLLSDEPFTRKDIIDLHVRLMHTQTEAMQACQHPATHTDSLRTQAKTRYQQSHTLGPSS